MDVGTAAALVAPRGSAACVLRTRFGCVRAVLADIALDALRIDMGPVGDPRLLLHQTPLFLHCAFHCDPLEWWHILPQCLGGAPIDLIHSGHKLWPLPTLPRGPILQQRNARWIIGTVNPRQCDFIPVV